MAVDVSLLRVLHHLEGIASSNKLGTLAENLLEALSSADDVKRILANLRNQTRDAKKSLALAKRQKILQEMAFQRSKKNPSLLQASQAIAGVEQLDEQGLRCLVCQEGYSYKPSEIMGLYVFNKTIPLSAEEDDVGVSTVTHFNVIHYSCHFDAVKADRRLKPPKSEWEGAAIRNSHTLCNNLFPIHGMSLSDQMYDKKVEDYWALIAPSGKLTHFELLVEDLRTLLSKFAYEESFSEYTKGGAKESNIKFILYLIQMGMHLFEKSPPRSSSRVCDTSELPVTTLVETLMLWSFTDWEQQKFLLLRNTLFQQIAQDELVEVEEKVGREEKHNVELQEKISQEDLNSLCRPVFLMFALIDAMHKVLHKPRSQSEPDTCLTIAAVLTHRKRHIRAFDCLILEDLENTTLPHYLNVTLPCKTVEAFLAVIGMDAWLLAQGSSESHLISQLQTRLKVAN